MFEAKVVGFLCTWCSYTGADTAGIARLKVPSNLRAVRVPCSGRVSPELVMRAFDQGADGVLVLACHIGECHYDTGNHRTAKRMPVLDALLNFTGLERERLRLDYVSASEGERFSRIVTEFSQAVRELGPVRWRASKPGSLASPVLSDAPIPQPTEWELDLLTSANLDKAKAIQSVAHDLLSKEQVQCVIGFERGPRGNIRPAFIYNPNEVERLVWNQECTHNLVTYARERLTPSPGSKQPEAGKPVALVVKACDSRAVNVLFSEGQFSPHQVYLIGVVCDGMFEYKAPGYASSSNFGERPSLQSRCMACVERKPLVYDTLVGESPAAVLQVPSYDPVLLNLSRIKSLSTGERAEFWLSQFDRCIRCYACRQVCPMCNCPECLYERFDALWVGLRIGLDEKRAYHLGRAFHLAGRCIGCNECERVCPVNIPISLLNRHLAQEIKTLFGYQAGLMPVASPLATCLSGAESRSTVEEN